MASPEVIDFAKLLAPIAADRPAGDDLRLDSSPGSLYAAVKDARAAARAAERQLIPGEEPDPASLPDWRPVLQNGVRALSEKTKDLDLTTYVIEALVRLHGFAGLRDGFRLARELGERFWDGLYPLPDADGLASRVATFSGLNGKDAEGTLLAPLSQVPITEATSAGRFNCAQYQQALALKRLADPKARERRIAQGAATEEMLRKAAAESSARFFQNLAEDLAQCSEQFSQLCAALEKRCGGQAPPSSAIRAALENCLVTIKDLARDKLDKAPAPAAPPTGDGAPTPAPAARGEADVEPILTREDAFRALLKIAEFFRRTEPHTIVSYTLEQVVRWGRMPLPELLAELIPEDAARKSLFKQVGIRAPEPPAKK